MAFAGGIHHRVRWVVSHATGAAAEAHHTQRGFAPGMGGCLHHHLRDRVVFHLLEGIDPAVHQPVVGLAVVGDLVDPDLVVVEPHLVVGIRTNFRHGPPGHRAGGQTFEAEVGDQLGYQRQHRR